MSISGKVELLVGFEKRKPIEPFLVLKKIGDENQKFIEVDSLGYFEVKNLTSGEYSIINLAGQYSNPEFKLTLEEESKNEINIVYLAECLFNNDLAKIDIEKGQPRLVLVGGIAPVVYEQDSVFEDQFGIKYEDLGCLADGDGCAESYNEVIFEYLDKTFGKKWRGKVRKDVEGFKAWKKDH